MGENMIYISHRNVSSMEAVSGFQIFDRNREWDQFLETIQGFGKLSQNWDNEGASAPKPLVVYSLLRFLSGFKAENPGMIPSCASVGSDGEIIVTWKDADWLMELETEEAEVFEFMTRKKGSPPEFSTVITQRTPANFIFTNPIAVGSGWNNINQGEPEPFHNYEDYHRATA